MLAGLHLCALAVHSEGRSGILLVLVLTGLHLDGLVLAPRARRLHLDALATSRAWGFTAKNSLVLVLAASCSRSAASTARRSTPSARADPMLKLAGLVPRVVPAGHLALAGLVLPLRVHGRA